MREENFRGKLFSYGVHYSVADFVHRQATNRFTEDAYSRVDTVLMYRFVHPGSCQCQQRREKHKGNKQSGRSGKLIQRRS